MNIKRRIGGRIAKATGAQFENIIRAQCHFQKIACVPIPSGMKVAGSRNGRPFFVPTPSPFDFNLGYQGKALYIDAKSTERATFSHSQLVDHQLHFLDLMKSADLLAGYVICFSRKEDPQVAFFDVTQLKALKPRESVSLEDGLRLGSLYEIDLRLIFDNLVSIAPKEITHAIEKRAL